MTDIAKVKKLRDETSLSFGQIKKALDEADGNEVKAKEVLKRLGIDMAVNKSSRGVKEGIIEAYIHSHKKLGSMLELLCETDFVARGDDFKSLAHDIAMHLVAMRPNDVDELLMQPFVKEPSMTIKDLINKVIAKLGENIKIGKFIVYEI
jgi:elongation factor Ts